MFYNSPRQKKKKKSFGKIVSSRVYNTNRIKMPSSFPSSSPYISGVLLSSQTQKQGEREREREGIGKKCRFQFLRHKISKFQKRNNINPLLSRRRQKSVFRLRRNGRRDTERERKRNQAFKIKSGALLYSSFPRCSKAQSKTFWVSQMHLSLLSLCVGCWWSYKKDKKKHRRRRRRREKRKEFFF